MRRQGAAFLVCCLLGSLVMTGCGSDSFVPPPPAGARPATGSTYAPSSSPAKEVAMILPIEDNADTATWETVARQEAGLEKLGFRSLRPERNSPPSRQAELIKQAAATASGLLVITNGSPETTAALAAVDTKKTPIVLVGRPLPPSPEADKVQATYVNNAPFAESAKQLVTAAVEEARKRVELAKGPLEAALVRSKVRDDSNDQRAKALLDAAKAAGLQIVADETFDGSVDKFVRLIQTIHKNHPRIAILLCEEEGALSGMTAVRHDVAKDQPPAATDPAKALDHPVTEKAFQELKSVGYIATKTNINLIKMGHVTALGDRNVNTIARDALLLLRDKMAGKDVGPKREVPITIIRAPAESGLVPKG